MALFVVGYSLGKGQVFIIIGIRRKLQIFRNLAAVVLLLMEKNGW